MKAAVEHRVLLHYWPDLASICIHFNFITTTTLFLFYLGYVMYVVKLARYLTWLHHRLTASLYFYMRACKCQLFTDEDRRRLPKRLNYCFSVLASATNRSIWVFLATQVYIVSSAIHINYTGNIYVKQTCLTLVLCSDILPSPLHCIPQRLWCEYRPIPATFHPCSIERFCGDTHHWGSSSPQDPNYLIMCKTVHFKMATLSGCLFRWQVS